MMVDEFDYEERLLASRFVRLEVEVEVDEQ